MNKCLISCSFFHSEVYLAINFYKCQILGKVPNHHFFLKLLILYVFPHPSFNSFLYSFLASSIDSNLETIITGSLVRSKIQPWEIKIALIMGEGFNCFQKGKIIFFPRDVFFWLRKFFKKKKGVSFAPIKFKKQDNPHHPTLCKILALHVVFVSKKYYLLVGLFVVI